MAWDAGCPGCLEGCEECLEPADERTGWPDRGSLETLPQESIMLAWKREWHGVRCLHPADEGAMGKDRERRLPPLQEKGLESGQTLLWCSQGMTGEGLDTHFGRLSPVRRRDLVQVFNL